MKPMTESETKEMLYKQPWYRKTKSKKTAGYQKYYVDKVRHGSSKWWYLWLKGTNWHKQNSQPEILSITVEDNKIVHDSRVWFLSPLEYFLNTYSKRSHKQYLFEYNQIRNKYPEEFL